MAKELYLYTPIWSFSAEDMIRQLEENSKEDIVIRMMSPGGGVFAGWGIAAKMKEKKVGTITAKVDGAVASMASTILFYADKVMALSVSSIMLHRAAGPATTPEEKEFLNKVNKDLRTAMEKRINSEKLKALKGHTVADLFENEIRIDLYLSADEAKEVGLVDEIFDMSPQEVEAMGEFGKFFGIAANTNNPQNQNTMTLQELQAKHPELFAQVLAMGVKKEHDRVLAWAHFADVDADGSKKGIAGADEITQVQIIEFMEKKHNAKALGALEKETGENTPAAGTKAEDDKIKAEKESKEKKEKESTEFTSNVQNLLGVKF